MAVRAAHDLVASESTATLIAAHKEWGSMGFVSVIIVTGLFALGLPLVLL